MTNLGLLIFALAITSSLAVCPQIICPKECPLFKCKAGQILRKPICGCCPVCEDVIVDGASCYPTRAKGVTQKKCGIGSVCLDVLISEPLVCKLKPQITDPYTCKGLSLFTKICMKPDINLNCINVKCKDPVCAKDEVVVKETNECCRKCVKPVGVNNNCATGRPCALGKCIFRCRNTIFCFTQPCPPKYICDYRCELV